MMRARRLFRTMFAAVCLAVAACGDDGDGGGPLGSNPSLTGHWEGDARFGTVRFSADFEQHAGGDVTGTGRFSSPLGGDDFNVVGTVAGAQVNLTLLSDEYGVTTYVGRFVARDRVTGDLDGGSLGEFELTMDRE